MLTLCIGTQDERKTCYGDPMPAISRPLGMQPKRRERSIITRLRILDAAFMMIARDGINAITMQGVAAAANVTEMTVYNLFGSKTGLIDRLVEKYQGELVARSDTEDTSSLPGIRDAVRAIALDLGRAPQWAGAIAHLYYSEKTEPQTYERLRAIGLRHLRLAADLLKGGAGAEPGSSEEMAMHLFANTGYALVHDLALGRIEGDKLADLLVFALDAYLCQIAALRT